MTLTQHVWLKPTPTGIILKRKSNVMQHCDASVNEVNYQQQYIQSRGKKSQTRRSCNICQPPHVPKNNRTTKIPYIHGQIDFNNNQWVKQSSRDNNLHLPCVSHIHPQRRPKHSILLTVGHTTSLICCGLSTINCLIRIYTWSTIFFNFLFEF